MTAVLWKDNALYTDSFMEKDGEWLQVHDKAVVINKPCRLHSLGIVEHKDGRPGKLNDWIVGFSYTGASGPANAVMKMLIALTERHFEPPLYRKVKAAGGTYDALIENYNIVASAEMLNEDNHFVILMIGLKNNYVASFTTDAGFVVLRADKNAVQALGSGETAIRGLIARSKNTAVPIRLMWHAMHVEASCGGYVHRYEILRNSQHPSGYQLTLTGLWKPPTHMQRSVSELLCEKDNPPALDTHIPTPKKRKRP